MANRLAPRPVEIELDRQRTLLLDLNALATFRETTGKEFLDFLAELKPEGEGEEAPANYAAALKMFSPSNLRALLHACLVHEDESLTLHDVGRMIGFGNMAYVGEKLGEAMRAGMPKPGKDGSGETEQDGTQP